MKKTVYAAAEVGAFLLVAWTAGGAAAAFGYGGLAQALTGLAVGAVFALVSVSVTLKWRETNDRIAEMVKHELERRDTAESVTALADAVSVTGGRHRLADEDTGQLFTHDGLYGAYAMGDMPDTDVAEASPARLFTDNQVVIRADRPEQPADAGLFGRPDWVSLADAVRPEHEGGE